MSGWQPPQYDPRQHRRHLYGQQAEQSPVQPSSTQQPDPREHWPHAAPPRRAAYPSHLTRFPVGLIPRGRRRRRHGHSIGYFVWLGSHPVLTLLAVAINFYLVALVLGWIAAVTAGWLVWTMAATVWWLASMPFRKT